MKKRAERARLSLRDRSMKTGGEARERLIPRSRRSKTEKMNQAILFFSFVSSESGSVICWFYFYSVLAVAL